jgi:hypothetical protein
MLGSCEAKWESFLAYTIPAKDEYIFAALNLQQLSFLYKNMVVH